MTKSVLVTGATNGTGYAIASRFAKEGYDVFITSRELDRAESAAAEIAEKYGVFAKGFALAPPDEQAVQQMFSSITALGKTVNTVVCNAANLGINMDTLTATQQEFMEVVTTNMGWNFTIAQTAAQRMVNIGGGSIVFINSNTAYRAIPGRVAYSASKGGVLSMARALALDLGKYNIRVNCVLPGMIKTTRWQASSKLHKVPSNYTPLGDIAEFEDIANAAYYFGSDQSRNTTGAELTVDGGNMIQLYPIIPENE